MRDTDCCSERCTGQILVRTAVHWDGTAEWCMLNLKELIKEPLESVQSAVTPLTFRALPYHLRSYPPPLDLRTHSKMLVISVWSQSFLYIGPGCRPGWESELKIGVERRICWLWISEYDRTCHTHTHTHHPHTNISFWLSETPNETQKISTAEKVNCHVRSWCRTQPCSLHVRGRAETPYL